MFTQTSPFRFWAARITFLGLFLSVVPILPMEQAKQFVEREVRARSAHGSVTIGVNAGEQPQELKAKIIPMEDLAANVLQEAPLRDIPGLEDSSVFDENAKKELQLDLLHKTLDNTQTYVGSRVFEQSIDATNDLAEIERRQNVIQKFISDPKLFNGVSQALHTIAKNESSVLSYWNAEDPVFMGAAKLYFNLGPFKGLNNSKLALGAMTTFDAGLTFKSLVGTLFLQGLFNELHRWYVFGGAIDKSKIVAGFGKHISDHNFLGTNYMHDDVVQQFQAGTVNDNACEELGRHVYTDGTFLDNVRFSEAVHAKHVAAAQGTAVAGLVNGWERITSYKASAWFGQFAAIAFWDYLIYKSARASIDTLKDTHRNLEALRARMIGVAEFIKGIQKLEEAIAASPELQNQLPAKLKNDIALSKSLSVKMREFVALLNTATFKQSKSMFYSRGKVLYANKLFAEIKHELIPAMKALGEIDAYCAIARLMKVSAQDANKFTFVTFTNSAQAYMELDSCWIAVLDPQEAVANSMALGQKHSGKMIITGPNGGGKSTHLKATGQAAWMAHAWGIAPARKARMSILDAVRTSMEPREDLEHGLSKFMAQKESMDKIQQFILDEPNKISLILLDEPYDGTVTDEIARRAGEFCDGIVASKNCLAIVATHIMPTLANAKLYSWYHVDIAEPAAGIFRRTFRLRRGVAKRWFKDQAWRGRFIDWLSIEMRKKALAQVAQ